MAEVTFESTTDGHFQVAGPLTFLTVGKALEAGCKLFEDHKHIELDLHGVEATDSAGLALLVEWAGWAHREKRTILFHHLPKQAQALARISEVEKLLPNS